MCLVLACRVNIQPDGLQSVIALSQGDMRRAINILQVLLFYVHFTLSLVNMQYYVYNTLLETNF